MSDEPSAVQHERILDYAAPPRGRRVRWGRVIFLIVVALLIWFIFVAFIWMIRWFWLNLPRFFH